MSRPKARCSAGRPTACGKPATASVEYARQRRALCPAHRAAWTDALERGTHHRLAVYGFGWPRDDARS